MQRKTPLGTLLTWLVAGVVVIAAVKLAFIVLGLTLAVLAIAIKLLPFVLAVWLTVVAVRWLTRPQEELPPL